MNKLVTVRDFLKTYNITKDILMEEVNKDKDFYDKYIEWENLDADSIITPKALARLGEVFNEPTSNNAPEMTITINGEVQETVVLDTLKAEKPRKKRKQKATENDTIGEQVEMSDFMNKPDENTNIEKNEPEKKSKKSNSKPRRKKSKYSVTKQFLSENGRPEDMSNIRQLRQFLMSDGSHKIEDVALMTDDEVRNEFTKSFYIINADNGTYIIARTALNSIVSDICFVEKE